MKPRLILVSLALAALTILSFGIQAQEQPKKASGPTQAEKDEFQANQLKLTQQFKHFRQQLFTLKQSLDRGTEDEKKRAKVIEAVLEECDKLAIGQEFARMNDLLKTSKINTTDGLKELQEQSDIIANNMYKVLKMLRDNNPDLLSQKRKDLEDLIKKLDQNIKSTQQVQAITDLGKTDSKELAKIQNKEAQKTDEIAKGLKEYLDKDKIGKGGEAAKPKGEIKDGGKGDGKKGEAKDAGEKKKDSEAAKGESKDAGKDSKGAKGEAKASDKKDSGQPSKSGDKGDPKASAKPGEKKDGSQPAGAKDNKSGQKGKEGAAKENKGEPKTGEKNKEGSAKDAGKADKKDNQPQGQAKSGNDEKKPSDPSSEAKPGAKGSPDGQPSGAKGNKQAPADVKGGTAKGGAAKGGESKAGQGQGQAKSGSESQGQAQAKDGGASPKAGNQPDQGQQAAQKGDNQPPPPPSSNKDDDKQNQDVARSQKKVKEAGYDQSEAEEKIAKQNNAAASKKQADAIKKMQDAKKQLERLLQQMREDEIERVLAALQNRCEKMLKMQIAVLATTVAVHKDVALNVDKKPNESNKKESLKLSDEEKLIVDEANKCIDILQAEGSAVAFPEVFQQVRDDMIHVKKRLELTEVGEKTQNVERDIIDTLREMIEALKKARQDNQDPDNKPGKAGKGGQPGDQKLLELIQELKMVRSLQKRINDRTKVWGKDQESTKDVQTVRELRVLSERQLRIQAIVSRIAKGDNK